MKEGFNKNKTIEDIERYIEERYTEGLEKETASQLYKPFFTIYVKKRHWLNPIRFIFGWYKYRWFEKGKQRDGYENAFEAEGVFSNYRDKK